MRWERQPPNGSDGTEQAWLSILICMKSTGRTWWPTLCRVCRRWQNDLLCRHCVELASLGTPRCPRCGLACAGALLEPCARCQDWPPTFDHALTALDYTEPWASLITSLKFRQDPALAGFLGALLATQVRQRWAWPTARPRAGHRDPSPALRRGAPTVVVPVPLSATRLKERGYNQAWLLAREVAAAWRLPVLPDALIRQRDTARLMSLDADQRLQQIRGAFAVAPARLSAMAGRHVAVVDDVLTTGATLNEIASTLWLAGAREVSVWVVARTPLPQSGVGD